jgi:UDP-N-acetylglucosamine:LPS N-acetylglucosamine transferase
MVIVEPIPGQEHWNADYVVGAGAGVQVRVSEMVPFVVQNLLNDTERLHMLAHRASSVGKPQSAMTIVEQVLDLTGVREISVVS